MTAIEQSRNGSTGSAIMAQFLAAANSVSQEESRDVVGRQVSDTDRRVPKAFDDETPGELPVMGDRYRRRSAHPPVIIPEFPRVPSRAQSICHREALIGALRRVIAQANGRGRLARGPECVKPRLPRPRYGALTKGGRAPGETIRQHEPSSGINAWGLPRSFDRSRKTADIR